MLEPSHFLAIYHNFSLGNALIVDKRRVQNVSQTVSSKFKLYQIATTSTFSEAAAVGLLKPRPHWRL